ncbi:hypothetical protein BST11_03250 [Mycobacterium alsense]|uniref:DUF4145 domain-containing protein n=1 Tax=Mycobacterium alsense TaxID=324058 RepID=A0AA42BXJ7_9MYCO|nr:hypothetical protein [Mycobacterium alsense]MCV7377652.1 hypothetical protein [Mycobacterium alsense]OQZ93020.1 hypothetical protein BST11_03250 [Mycobacterium alsense]
MANLKNPTKQKLEHLLNMRTGYVLDFTNATFQDFILTSVGIDVDKKYPDGSKAVRLRSFWQRESDETVATLMMEMLDRWRTSQLMSNGLSPEDQTIYEQAMAELKVLIPDDLVPSADEIAFLDKDLGNIDLSAVPVPLTFQEVIEQRRQEIELCLRARAPLAVIFLCGSTLEGLLFAVAESHPKEFNQATAAPIKEGSVKPFGEWTLQNLIDVSRELGLVGEDVLKHAHAVRDFRNYIHPRQQIRENFTPRMFTAEMADKVLQAAIADLASRDSS